MDEEFGRKFIAVAFIVMLIISGVTMYAMMSLLDSMHEDPYDHTYEYELSGTARGSACEGTGIMEYVPENANYRLYNFSGSIVSSDGKTDKVDLGALFDKDGTMVSSLYTFLRNDTVNGEAVTVWHCDHPDENYTFYVGAYCKVLRMEIVSDDYELIGMVK